jgi:hypothetical protein
MFTSSLFYEFSFFPTWNLLCPVKWLELGMNNAMWFIFPIVCCVFTDENWRGILDFECCYVLVLHLVSEQIELNLSASLVLYLVLMLCLLFKCFELVSLALFLCYTGYRYYDTDITDKHYMIVNTTDMRKKALARVIAGRILESFKEKFSKRNRFL